MPSVGDIMGNTLAEEMSLKRPLMKFLTLSYFMCPGVWVINAFFIRYP